MNLKRYDWNVVIMGCWNLAILTPDGIAKRLYGLESGIPIQVEVPFNGIAPYRVKYENLTVTAEKRRLIIYANTPNYEVLDQAKATAAKAIKNLPETPLIAAGFNIRMSIEEPQKEFLDALNLSLDELLSDAKFLIESRGFRRTLKCDNGLLNLSIEQKNDIKVEFNFHRQSSLKDDLIEWLNYPIEKARDTVNLIFEKVIGIQIGEMEND